MGLIRRLFSITPISIAAIYLIMSVIWIFTSDLLLAELGLQGENYLFWQTVKGTFFVSLTGLVIYLLVKSYSKKIRRNEMQLQMAGRVAGLGYWFYHVENGEVEWSEEASEIFGIPNKGQKLTSEEIEKKIVPEDRHVLRKATKKALEEGTPFNLNFRIFKKNSDNKYRYLNSQCDVTTNAQGEVIELYGTILDISKQVGRQQELEKSLDEKNILIQEIHHRVKNNLAIISGLLQLQLFSSDDDRLTNILEDSLMRIYSIALVHELLYKSSDFGHVSNREYITELVDRIQQTFEDDNQNITVEQHIEDVSININQAVPCAMLINELIINAYRHAFNNHKEGNIIIQLFQQDSIIHLEITDTGKGLPQTFSLDDTNTNTLGSQLIQLLTKQLHGNIEFKSSPGKGTTFHVSFKKEGRSGSSSIITESDT